MRRRGFALLAALIAVVLIGALIVGAFVASTEETRASGNFRTGQTALYAAETALEVDAAGWAAAQADSVAVAQSVSHTVTGSETIVTTKLVRLDSTIYWLVADASAAGQTGTGTPLVRRRLGLLTRRISDSTGKTTLLRLGERPWSELF